MSPSSSLCAIRPHQPLSTHLLRANDSRVLVAAHRGACTSAPENSIASIQHAIAQGADIVELDVRSTADDALVLLHDPTLDRTTTGTGLLAQHRFEQVRGVQLKPVKNGLEANPEISGLPTLGRALEAARDLILVNIDLKDSAIAERVAQFVIAAGMGDQVFVKADVETQHDVDRWRASPLFGRIAFVAMMHARPGKFSDDLRMLEPLGCPMYEVAFSDVATLEEGREELRRQNARLWVNTIAASHSLDFNDARAAKDPDAVWGRLLRAGVGAIQTDDTAGLVRYLYLTAKGRR